MATVRLGARLLQARPPCLLALTGLRADLRKFSPLPVFDLLHLSQGGARRPVAHFHLPSVCLLPVEWDMGLYSHTFSPFKVMVTTLSLLTSRKAQASYLSLENSSCLLSPTWGAPLQF